MKATSIVFTAWVLLLASKISATKSDSGSDLIHFKTCRDSHNMGCKLAFDNIPETCYVSATLRPGPITSSNKDVWWEGDLGNQKSVEKVQFSGEGNTESVILDMFKNYKVTLDNSYECSHLGTSAGYKSSFRCDDKVTRKVKVAPGWNFYLRFCEVVVQGRQYSSCKNSDIYTLDEVSGKCYSKPATNLMTQPEAKEMCEKQGGRLPILKTNEDISYFESRVPDVEDNHKWYRGYWLGASQIKGEEFVYAWDGETEPIKKMNWQKGEPSSVKQHGVQTGIHTIANPKFKAFKGKWNNMNKTWKNYVICQEA